MDETRCKACDVRLPKLTVDLADMYGYSRICQPCLAAAAKLAGEEDSLATFRLTPRDREEKLKR